VLDIRMAHPCTPESPWRTRTPLTLDIRGPRLPVRLFGKTPHVITRQDNWALRPQNRAYLLPRPNSDLSSRFDKAGLRYRKLHQQLVARQADGDTAYLPDGDPGRDVRSDLGMSTANDVAA
jgi:Vanillate O-demethylase oxygenase C-terminal domain